MAFKSTYTGRTVDLSIFQFSGERLEGPITLSFGSPVKIITGIEKLKQVFAITLFTLRGTVLLDPSRGTEFGALSGTSNYDPGEIQHAANIAVAETVDVIIDDQVDSTVDIPDDEYLVDAFVTDIAVNTSDPSQVAAIVAISTRAGSTFDVFLPLPVAIT